MIGLLIGIFIGACVALILYSTIAGERINNLEYQNEVLMNELEQKKKDLQAYKCMYASSYKGFEELKNEWRKL